MQQISNIWAEYLVTVSHHSIKQSQVPHRQDGLQARGTAVTLDYNWRPMVRAKYDATTWSARPLRQTRSEKPQHHLPPSARAPPLTRWQHHFSTDLPPREGSSGTIRKIFHLDSSKSTVKFPVDKTDRLWLYIHRRYITGCIRCMSLPLPVHTAAECPRTDCRIYGR
jgi:hypothetical protein